MEHNPARPRWATPDLSRDEVQTLCDEKVWARALGYRKYLREKQAQGLKSWPSELSTEPAPLPTDALWIGCKVDGQYVYNVQAGLCRDGLLFSLCTCPVQSSLPCKVCKHVIALLLLYAELPREIKWIGPLSLPTQPPPRCAGEDLRPTEQTHARPSPSRVVTLARDTSTPPEEQSNPVARTLPESRGGLSVRPGRTLVRRLSRHLPGWLRKGDADHPAEPSSSPPPAKKQRREACSKSGGYHTADPDKIVPARRPLRSRPITYQLSEAELLAAARYFVEQEDKQGTLSKAQSIETCEGPLCTETQPHETCEGPVDGAPSAATPPRDDRPASRAALDARPRRISELTGPKPKQTRTSSPALGDTSLDSESSDLLRRLSSGQSAGWATGTLGLHSEPGGVPKTPTRDGHASVTDLPTPHSGATQERDSVPNQSCAEPPRRSGPRNFFELIDAADTSGDEGEEGPEGDEALSTPRSLLGRARSYRCFGPYMILACGIHHSVHQSYPHYVFPFQVLVRTAAAPAQVSFAVLHSPIQTMDPHKTRIHPEPHLL